jgi:hypothetical protein
MDTEKGEVRVLNLVIEYVPGSADPVESRSRDETRPIRFETDQARRG